GGAGVNVWNPVRAIEAFYVSHGVYNWTADAQGIYFLKQFVNSALASMMSGGSCACAFVNG
ncbi:hypothetical protein B0H13DRAFT_1488316, partial [Mycena leptocephala]